MSDILFDSQWMKNEKENLQQKLKEEQKEIEILKKNVIKLWVTTVNIEQRTKEIKEKLRQKNQMDIDHFLEMIEDKWLEEKWILEYLNVLFYMHEYV